MTENDVLVVAIVAAFLRRIIQLGLSHRKAQKAADVKAAKEARNG